MIEASAKSKPGPFKSNTAAPVAWAPSKQDRIALTGETSWTVKVTGRYSISAQVECSGLFNAGIRSGINNHRGTQTIPVVAEVYTANAGSTTKSKVMATSSVALTAGDQIRVWARVNISGADPSHTGNGTFSMKYLGK
ncbi:hypothetical protein ACFYXL_18185 [Streptomyces tsukubensis]|uniref:hypothetical protein n=1 Tax=Streptomyces tsukubensis TaxID=83656 RepID=UPI00368D8227